MANHHGGLIDPSNFPTRAVDLDLARIEQSATDLGRVGRAIEDGTVQVGASWSRLTGCYSAPEQEQVYRLMAPAVASAGSVRSALSRASGHLDTYASTLAALKPRLAAFEKRAAAFRAKVADGVWVDASSAKDASFGDHLAWAFDWVPGVDERRVKVPWYEDEHTVAKNGDLLDEYAGLLAEISAAASGCATAVDALVSGVHPDAVEPISAAAFTAIDGDPMPWGSPGIEDRNCRESVGHGGYEFGKSLVQGVGALLLGYNPANGHFWSGSTYAQTWGGAVDLVASLVLLSNPLYARDAAAASSTASAGGTLDQDAALMARRFDTAASAVGSLIGYDPAAEDGWHQWREDRWATGTEAVLNVGTFFIPGVGEAGGALKGASAIVKVTRLTEAAADFAVQGGSWVVRGGVRVVAGLRDALLHVHLDDLASTVRAGEVVDAGTLGARLNPTPLIHALDDAPAMHALPGDGRGDWRGAEAHEPEHLVAGERRLSASTAEAPHGGESGTGESPVDRHLAAHGSDVAAPAGTPDRGVTYRMEDGSEHITRYAPQQAPAYGAEHVIKDVLADRDVFARHGEQPWTRDDLVAKVMTPLGDLTSGELGVMREIADRLPPPSAGDPIQKILTPSQVQNLLTGASHTMGGSVARFEDVADLSTVQQLHDALRLDYDSSPFSALDRYHALRWEAPEDVRVSRHSSLGGDGTTDGWTDPYTGNGFLKSPDLIPEYRILKNADDELPPIRSGAEIWEISRDGLQRLVAAFDGYNWIGVAG